MNHEPKTRDAVATAMQLLHRDIENGVANHDDRDAVCRQLADSLLAGRKFHEMPSEDLIVLAQTYNWSGQNLNAFEAAKLVLIKDPDNQKFLEIMATYISNAYNFDRIWDLPKFLAACDACIEDKVGPAAFWHLLKADEYISFATGERDWEDYEWTIGDSILHPELLRPAAEAMEEAIDSKPDLSQDQSAQGWVRDWNTRFAAVLQQREFAHLRLATRLEDD